MLKEWTLEDFVPQLGQAFCMQELDAQKELTLTDAKAVSGQSGHARAPFVLLFRGPAGAALPQRIYALQHEELGAVELFLVPVGREGDSRDATRPVLYEAVFN